MILLHPQNNPRGYWLAPSEDDDAVGMRAEPGRTGEDQDRPLRILIVEDEGLVAINMELALAEAGFTVAGIADNETDAVLLAEHTKPDVVLMDITLRNGDGIAAAKTIAARIDTRIIFVSGNSDPRTIEAARALRPAAFIRKPFVSEQLPRLVRQAIGTRH